MTGEKLRNTLKGNGIKLKELAADLQVSSQGLQYVLNANKVKHVYLLAIERITGIKLTDIPLTNTKQTKVHVSNGIGINHGQINFVNSTIDLLHQLLSTKDEIIENLREKIRIFEQKK